jgi:prepilin-type N-terminal cleavage/methylation domain-containing protein
MRNIRKGFTLLELMIAISLMLIVMLMLNGMFRNAQEMYLRASKRVDVYSQARVALDSIEQDLLRMRISGSEDSVHMRSLSAQSFNNPENVRGLNMYSSLDDWSQADDNQTQNIREFLSFTGTNTWYDRETQKYITGDAFVAYYLRKRLPSEDGNVEGGYLVRRIIPVRSDAEIVRINMGKEKARAIYPSEDELASFVYATRVFVDDQAAFQRNARDLGFTYNTMPECAMDDPNAKWLWKFTQPGALPPTTKPQPGNFVARLQKTRDFDRVEFGGTYTTNTAPDRDFVSAKWNYPAVIMVELTMIDRNLERYDASTGDGTYRSFSRAVHLPVSGAMFRLDARDDELMSK